eukprot:Amastigsp_a349739_8.p2 type:complete len:175 gc:universal Amastigsp_a349739_8:520-1044(+)
MPGRQKQREPGHFHCHHQADQHDRPAQHRNQPWRRKQHCQRQGDLDHFPQKESGHSRARIHRPNLAGQTARKKRCRKNHRQRSVQGGPAGTRPSGQHPCQQGHKDTCHRLTRQHMPERDLGVILSKLLRFVARQRLEIVLFRLNSMARSSRFPIRRRICHFGHHKLRGRFTAAY